MSTYLNGQALSVAEVERSVHWTDTNKMTPLWQFNNIVTCMSVYRQGLDW
jgi:hypothetical protein